MWATLIEVRGTEAVSQGVKPQQQVMDGFRDSLDKTKLSIELLFGDFPDDVEPYAAIFLNLWGQTALSLERGAARPLSPTWDQQELHHFGSMP